MPLERLSDRSFICEPNGVRFGMRNAERTVLCVLTREALNEVFGSSDQGSGKTYLKLIEPLSRLPPAKFTTPASIALGFT